MSPAQKSAISGVAIVAGIAVCVVVLAANKGSGAPAPLPSPTPDIVACSVFHPCPATSYPYPDPPTFSSPTPAFPVPPASSPAAAHSSSLTSPINPTDSLRTYTVVRGDSVSAISAKTNVTWAVIYYLNAGQIEGAAKSNGMASSDNGHWIYSGETFVLPAVK